MSAPANFSASDFFPGITGIAASVTAKSAYVSSILPCFVFGFLLRRVRGVAFLPVKIPGYAERVLCAVSQRTTEFHWFIKTGKSRYDWKSTFDHMWPMMVSEVDGG